MTREDIKTIIDIVHETIYGFFDVCDEEETPMTDKDKLLLKINKAICTNIKALKQEPSGDLISRQAVLDLVADYDLSMGQVVRGIHALPPVKQELKTGHWISDAIQGEIDGQIVKAFVCSECGAISVFRMASGNIVNGDICSNCGAKMIDPQESEDKE